MLYYVGIPYKPGEEIKLNLNSGVERYDGNCLVLIARNEIYTQDSHIYRDRGGAHDFFGMLDVNFQEGYQYPRYPSKTQEAWLVGRHRITRILDFGNFGYQLVRKDKTTRLQFPDKIILSFDRGLNDPTYNPPDDRNRVDIEFTDLQEQIIHCYDKECDVDPVVFKLAKFDNYGDAYIDLHEIANYQEFKQHITHFVHFMKNYPNSNIFLVCRPEHESDIKNLLRTQIKVEHLTNYFEFCHAEFERKSPPNHNKKSGTLDQKSGAPDSEYDTFSQTMEEFFNEQAFRQNHNNEKNFYNVPFKKAQIKIDNNWQIYRNSDKFKKFLEHNPNITLEIKGPIDQDQVIEFIVRNKIKAHIILLDRPSGNPIVQEKIADNRRQDIQARIGDHGYDDIESSGLKEPENKEHRLSLLKYLPQMLNLSHLNNQNADLQVGQNQNQNHNQNQTQQLRQSNNAPYEPEKLEINNKASVPDLKFAVQDTLLQSLIGLRFQNHANAPQTETNIDHLFAIMKRIIDASPTSRDCYCPLSYNGEELIPGAFYIPKDKISGLPHPIVDFDEQRNTLFFSPPYASIAIKKDKYAFKPFNRPLDANFADVGSRIQGNKFIDLLLQNPESEKMKVLLHKLFAKRAQEGVDLLAKSLYSLNIKNPIIHQVLVNHYLPTSHDFSEFVDDPRYLATFDALAKLKDQKKMNWWNQLLQIQCRTNPHFDLNHLFFQFNSFWEDMEKLQKYMPIPEQFPFDDFADAGITLGKMYRIMIRARNRFEQIKSFERGNISHAYMLFDLFHTSMYCKEMDAYCIRLMQELKAEDAFDKSQLQETHFSTKKLAELACDPNVTLNTLKSYLYIFAAVNGNTEQHNNSDLAFYSALFEAIEASLRDKAFSDEHKKRLYASIMLLAAYGNNTTKERMILNVKTLMEQVVPIKWCDIILNIFHQEIIAKFFSIQDSNGKMANSDAMPSLHTVVTLTQKQSNYPVIICQATDLILQNKALSPAVQKIMRDASERMACFTPSSDYLVTSHQSNVSLIQSLFLMTVALNQNYSNPCSSTEWNSFRVKMQNLSTDCLGYLNQSFLDIDLDRLERDSNLFHEKGFGADFYAKASRAQNLDDVIFALQDCGVHLLTIKPSEKSTLLQIKKLEKNLSNPRAKNNYVYNYGELITKRLRDTLGDTEVVRIFCSEFVGALNSSFLPELLIPSYQALEQLTRTTQKDHLEKILPALQKFPIGHTQDQILPVQLLEVSAFLLKHIYPIESIVSFLDVLSQDSVQNANTKLMYLKRIFDKMAPEAECYEGNDTQNKLSRKTTHQIKTCMTLMNVIINMDDKLFDNLFVDRQKKIDITMSRYLEFLEALASPANIVSDSVKNGFHLINGKFAELLKQNPGCFSDLLEIARFDVELLINLPFSSRDKLIFIAKICKNERSLNSRKSEQPPKNYRQAFTAHILTLLKKTVNLSPFYSKDQLAHPSPDVLLQLLQRYGDNVAKALHHYEKDPWFKRPHKKQDIFNRNQSKHKELDYQTGFFDMSMQNDVLDQITSTDSPFEKSVRKSLLLSLSIYVNELGYSLPAFQHKTLSRLVNVPVRKLSDLELKTVFEEVKTEIVNLKRNHQNVIWQDKAYQRAVCKLLAMIREAMYRNGEKNAYSTQVDAMLLALLAGNYQYAMQINTGEGKAMIATAIAIALQTVTEKQIVITTSNLSLVGREAGVYNRLIEWFGITHASISASTKDKSKLQANIIHTTGNDFALCHGKDVLLHNGNRIYLNDEFDYTMSHLTPAINSQSKPNEEENWWIYEEILAYVNTIESTEAKRKPGQQAQGLIDRLRSVFLEQINNIEAELAERLFAVTQDGEASSEEEKMVTREAIKKDCYERIAVYSKRLAKLDANETADQFSRLIDSAIVAQFVLEIGVGYEVIDQLENGKILKKVVPTEGGKPITEGDVLYMYGIHQFLIQKTILAYRQSGDPSEFIKPSELESTTYFNNDSTQAGSKSISITGTVPKSKYKMYAALMNGGKSDVIPPHQKSKRVDAVAFERFSDIKTTHDRVCQTEELLIGKLVEAVTAHNGPALVYCSNKNVCEKRQQALSNQLTELGYTVQWVIPGVTEDFTDGEKLTTLGRQAQMLKTVTLTVGDGRGIDITPKGPDGLLTICSFVPETPEKLLQIYGRSGRNGNPGQTNLFILQSELKKYGISFKHLDEQFMFLDELRQKEFNFAIKKIGFMQYEIQKQIADKDKKTTLIGYMDDLYNKLVLRAVANKVNNQRENLINGYRVSGRWEPFVMLNDGELNQIYQEFCSSTADKLQEMKLYNIDLNDIQSLQNEYHQNAQQAIQIEQEAQKSLDSARIESKIKQHAEKQKSILSRSLGNTVELADGMDIDLTDPQIKSTYVQFAIHLSQYDKTVSMMQKYIGIHLGMYGYINNAIVAPYKQIYAMLEQQTSDIKRYKQNKTKIFYEYLIYKKCQDAINLLLEDMQSGSKRHQELIKQHVQNAQRYIHMSKVTLSGEDNLLDKIRDSALRYYENGSNLSEEKSNFVRLQNVFDRKIAQTQHTIQAENMQTINECKTVYARLRTIVFDRGQALLSQLVSRPMRENNPKLAHLFSILQMANKEERRSEPVKKLIGEISQEVIPKVDRYNQQVKKYKQILKQQRICCEDLNRSHTIGNKINKYDEMVGFDDIASKNMVVFYHDYFYLDGSLSQLARDITQEEHDLTQLEAERNRASYKLTVQKKISTALATLRARINEIDHPLTEALNVANTLFDHLEQAQNKYLESLGTALNRLDVDVKDFTMDSSIREVNQTYIKVCDTLINDTKTRRVLERDLYWGPFLKNLLKTIINIFISIFTCGTWNNFFPLTRSETIRIIDASRLALKPAPIGINPNGG